MTGLKPIAAALALAISLVLGGGALGEPHGHGGGPGWAHGAEGWRGGGPGGGWAGPPRGGYGYGRGGPPGHWAAPPRGYGYGGYAPPFLSPRLPAPGAYALRRGGRVPPQAWNYVIPDYGRHRLRPPPPGYSWVRMGDRYMLVSRQTGQIFDIIGR